jgi:uncharacterized protein YybS (DUF2232 family)
MGGSFSGTRVSVQVLVLAALTALLFAAARYVPVLGILISLLTPTPTLLVTLRYGLRRGLLVLGLSILSLALLFGNLQSSIFLAEYGVMALGLAEAIKRRWSVERTILAATALPALASGALIAVLIWSDHLNLVLMKQHFHEDLGQALRPLLNEGGGLSDEALQVYVQEAFEIVVQLLPALFVLSTAAGALLNYGVVRIMWRRLASQPPLPEIKLAHWKAPEACAWLLIASGIGSFVPFSGMQMVGLNILLLVSLINLLQGLGVMLFYMDRAAVRPGLRRLAYAMLLIQPLLLLGVVAFGLFDLWFDFRRIRDKWLGGEKMDLKTATTRYLCAAAHLDLIFRHRVIEQLVNDEHRAFGPSYGVDIVTIVKHCLAARHRKSIRDIILALTFLPIIFVVAISQDFVLLGPFLIIIPLTVIAWTAVISERWFSYFKIVKNYLLRNSFNQYGQEYLRDLNLEKQLEDRLKSQDGNVIVYSGFSPFVGSGFDIGGWSFALDIRKGKEQMGKTAKPQDFDVVELYDYLNDSLMELNLEGMNIEDKVYVNGRDIRFDTRFLADPFDRPCSQIEPSLLRHFMSNPTRTIRHYRCIRIVDWSGELVLSIFFRLSKIGHNLFIEASYFLLTPLDNYYHKIDAMNLTPTWKQQLILLAESTFMFPFVWVFSLGSMLFKISHPVRMFLRNRYIKHAINENLAFDYGATTSIREKSSSSTYDRYFQKLDKEMYIKIIERQILDKITIFLDSKEIDTSDFKQQKTEVFNNGVIISGGFITAENLAVGEGARARTVRLTRVISPKENASKNL